MPDDRPNVLFLMADEHRPDALGYAGDDTVRTPTLDALSEGAVRFSNAYTPSPVCIPARQCLAAGARPSTIDVHQYGEDLDPGHLTFARQFARHGYMTVAAGKLHHAGWDQMQGWRKRLAGDLAVYDRHVEGEAARDDEDWKWSDAKEIKRAGVADTTTHDGYLSTDDEAAVDAAVDFLHEYYTSPHYDRASPDRPLMLTVSLSKPHYPYLTTEDRLTYYMNRVEPTVEAPPFDHPTFDDHRVAVGPDGDVTEREARRATAAYYGMIDQVDSLFERVLDAIEHVGEDPDDWVIVYTSDHGEMLGDHGVWEKKQFFDASARVPLFVRAPGFDARDVDANVSLVDLYATLCDLADVPVPEGLDSESLVPLMGGDADARN
jgi:choline-sulfatase